MAEYVVSYPSRSVGYVTGPGVEALVVDGDRVDPGDIAEALSAAFDAGRASVVEDLKEVEGNE